MCQRFWACSHRLAAPCTVSAWLLRMAASPFQGGYHFSTTFLLGAKQAKKKEGSGDLAMSKALIGSQSSVER